MEINRRIRGVYDTIELWYFQKRSYVLVGKKSKGLSPNQNQFYSLPPQPIAKYDMDHIRYRNVENIKDDRLKALTIGFIDLIQDNKIYGSGMWCIKY